jgi:hypothetical protein
MYFFLVSKNQYELLNSSIKSANDLVSLLHGRIILDEMISTTIYRIFLFLSKVISSLPDFLISEYNYRQLKNELCVSMDNVLYYWLNFNTAPVTFFRAWDEFIFWWDEFQRVMQALNSTDSFINLYMN